MEIAFQYTHNTHINEDLSQFSIKSGIPIRGILAMNTGMLGF
jgi:hypothetical protein